MSLNNHSIFKTGDWIKGNLQDGEIIIGYIEALDLKNGTVKVTVIKSEAVETIGKKISISSKHVKRLSISKVVNKEQILFLIDLALSTGDEDWFIDLSAKLNSMRKKDASGIHRGR
ncbi:IDEAL domain-containing protein [Peribacillus frigoritolerans]|uniref:IDEAL domain-containing protein n=1 Tax=Peribacillus frigoritolerans TaxID=450367 RepID=UPI001059837F|nr:IDEAL domain-containing protein [Peribacillus frigoritolerans]TDL82856.1 IDEAL domain-containing protein [Peribacillus frigoritolerans]